MHLLNTSIIPSASNPQIAVTVPVTLDTARALCALGIVSHVGHASTAALLSTLLGVQVPLDRTPWVPVDAPLALVIQVRGRPPEGQILTVEEIEALGYDLRVLIVTSTLASLRQIADTLATRYADVGPAYWGIARITLTIDELVGRAPNEAPAPLPSTTDLFDGTVTWIVDLVAFQAYLISAYEGAPGELRRLLRYVAPPVAAEWPEGASVLDGANLICRATAEGRVLWSMMQSMLLEDRPARKNDIERLSRTA